jgi:hypothetical protein
MPNMQTHNMASATLPATNAAPNINVAAKNANEMAITSKPKVSLVIRYDPYSQFQYNPFNTASDRVNKKTT